jgi:hypothetical protein
MTAPHNARSDCRAFGVFNEDTSAAKNGAPTFQGYTLDRPAVQCSIVCTILEWRRRKPTSAASVTFVSVRANRATDSADPELELPSSAVELVSETFYIV